jgi:hypothetical protein
MRRCRLAGGHANLRIGWKRVVTKVGLAGHRLHTAETMLTTITAYVRWP